MRRVVSLVLFACACRPQMPDEATARAAFEQRRAAIGRFDDSVLVTLGIRNELDEATMRSLVRSADAIGLAGNDMVPSAPPCPPSSEAGSIDPESGVEIDGHRVGWGLYHVTGDTAVHPGIAVSWKMGGEDSMLGRVTMCWLLDGTVAP